MLLKFFKRRKAESFYSALPANRMFLIQVAMLSLIYDLLVSHFLSSCGLHLIWTKHALGAYFTIFLFNTATLLIASSFASILAYLLIKQTNFWRNLLACTTSQLAWSPLLIVLYFTILTLYKVQNLYLFFFIAMGCAIVSLLFVPYRYITDLKTISQVNQISLKKAFVLHLATHTLLIFAGYFVVTAIPWKG